MVFHTLDPKPHEQRVILVPANYDAPVQLMTVQAGYENYNAAIAARWGDVVSVRLPAILAAAKPTGLHVDLWIDDEGMLVNSPNLNARASALAGRVIAGDALVMCTRNGSSVTMPQAIEAAVMQAISPEDGKPIVELR